VSEGENVGSKFPLYSSKLKSDDVSDLPGRNEDSDELLGNRLSKIESNFNEKKKKEKKRKKPGISL